MVSGIQEKFKKFKKDKIEFHQSLISHRYTFLLKSQHTSHRLVILVYGPYFASPRFLFYPKIGNFAWSIGYKWPFVGFSNYIFLRNIFTILQQVEHFLDQQPLLFLFPPEMNKLNIIAKIIDKCVPKDTIIRMNSR